jgi:hypothetical protein
MDRPFDETCPKCCQGKFHMHGRGFFPKLKGATNEHIFRSTEFFRSGGSAWRAVIASNKMYQSMMDFDLKGVGFVPLAA